MLQSSNNDALRRMSFLVGSPGIVESMSSIPSKEPFNGEVLAFLDTVSKRLMANPASRAYSDAVTFAFWIRRASTKKLGERFAGEGKGIRLGRGMVFHIAPSNVPVNFAYSLVAGLLCGNANVVRVPSKDFPQVEIIAKAIADALSQHEVMRPYVALVRYGRDRDINNALSALCNVRVVWGGDATIAELRKSPLPARSTEVTFADRYSVAVIDSDAYLELGDKARVALDFYNDTYFSDQNACTSPRVVAWTGSRIAEAKHSFWNEEHRLVMERYELQPVVAVNKLTTANLAAVAFPESVVEPREDNLVVRVKVSDASSSLMDLRDSCGYFYEIDCKSIDDLRELLNDTRCQTVGYIGDPNPIVELVKSGVCGVDRIVPVGKTMDFDLIWDGYDLATALTRSVAVWR